MVTSSNTVVLALPGGYPGIDQGADGKTHRKETGIKQYLKIRTAYAF
jgi:hypothetical protein